MKLGRHAAVVEPHPRAVGVEDPDDPRLHAVIAVIGHGDRLGEPLGLVVAAARADRVDVAPVVFALGVDLGIAVDLRRAGQQEPGVLRLGQPERVVGSQRADLERRDRMRQVIDGAGRAGEMQDVVHRAVDLDRLGDVVLDEPESGFVRAAARCSAGCRSAGCPRRSPRGPRPRNRSQRCDPMNPAPPVMTVLNVETPVRAWPDSRLPSPSGPSSAGFTLHFRPCLDNRRATAESMDAIDGREAIGAAVVAVVPGNRLALTRGV